MNDTVLFLVQGEALYDSNSEKKCIELDQNKLCTVVQTVLYDSNDVYKDVSQTYCRPLFR